MKFDLEQRTLSFHSLHEIEEFHRQLTMLLRMALTESTRGVEDAEAARKISQGVFRECAAVTRALNALRTRLPRGPQRGGDDPGDPGGSDDGDATG